MKTLILSFALASVAIVGYAHNKGTGRITQAGNSGRPAPADSIKLRVDGNTAYYQGTVKVDSDIRVSAIYLRALQLMAAKNFTQNYGYEQEGKLILTTTQDLNANAAFGGDNDDPDPYTVQFAITLDMKNARYRYTISNIIFYLPTQSGNRRMTMYEIYQKAVYGDSRRIQKSAKLLIDSFERYLLSLTGELYAEIEHKAAIYDSKF